MISNTKNSGFGNIQQAMIEIYQKMKTADKEGITGLSKEELSSINFENYTNKFAFMKSLSEKFNTLDTNKNEQLSINEIISSSSFSDLIKNEITSTIHNASDNFGKTQGSFSGSFVQKLLNNYKNTIV